ncbi:MAG: hypothetical protein RL684_1711 [Pseudomonadota bacterium]
MRILVSGARGFIGSALAARLAAAGHEISRGVRRVRGERDVLLDYTQPFDRDAWRTRLEQFDAVVNAVGILVQSGRQTFEALHHTGPARLFEAAAAAGVRRVLQLSALGAVAGETPYFRSKLAADRRLMELPLAWQILRPSIVYGQEGDSSRMFRLLARLPLVPLPAGGHQLVQPVHIDDLCDAAVRLIDPATQPQQCIDAVGARALEFREMLAVYRQSLAAAPAMPLHVPGPLIALLAHTLGRLPGVVLTPDNWRMLQSGNVADPAPFAALLGREPLPIEQFVSRR